MHVKIYYLSVQILICNKNYANFNLNDTKLAFCGNDDVTCSNAFVTTSIQCLHKTNFCIASRALDDSNAINF